MYVLLAQLPSLERLLANAGLKHLNDTRLQSINREKHQNYHGPAKLFYRCWHTFTGFFISKKYNRQVFAGSST